MVYVEDGNSGVLENVCSRIQNTWNFIPEAGILHSHCHQNLKFHESNFTSTFHMGMKHDLSSENDIPSFIHQDRIWTMKMETANSSRMFVTAH
jgi:hypothetical protein